MNRQVGVGNFLRQGMAEEMLEKGFPARLAFTRARVFAGARIRGGSHVFFTQRSQQSRPVRLTVDLLNLFSHDPNKQISTRCLEADQFHADLIEDQQDLNMHKRSKPFRGTAFPKRRARPRASADSHAQARRLQRLNLPSPNISHPLQGLHMYAQRTVRNLIPSKEEVYCPRPSLED